MMRLRLDCGHMATTEVEMDFTDQWEHFIYCPVGNHPDINWRKVLGYQELDFHDLYPVQSEYAPVMPEHILRVPPKTPRGKVFPYVRHSFRVSR